MEILIWFTIFTFVMIVIGALIGQNKGRIGAGIILTILLGPLGWILVALGPNMKPKCPACGGIVVVGMRKCKNCGEKLR